MEPLKNMYSPSFFDKFSDILKEVIPGFDKKSFIEQIFTPDFERKELKERMRHTTLALHNHLPESFPETITVFELLTEKLREKKFDEYNFIFISLADYIEVYGIDDFETSARAFEMVTRLISCEFAVRPFILKYGDRMIDQMIEWSLHENRHVRRLSSEGCRPRLPWAMALPCFKADPKPILPILENLKNDSDESVRRSVANNLNDIAKDNPEIVVEIANRWKGQSEETDRVIKHGCRTLLKQAYPPVLELYGLNSKHISVSNIVVEIPRVKIGDSLSFTFELENKSETKQTVRIEYGLYYQKANGSLSRKVFKISERILEANEKINVVKKQSFEIITTRKFHVGEHRVSVIANGMEMGIASFELIG